MFIIYFSNYKKCTDRISLVNANTLNDWKDKENPITLSIEEYRRKVERILSYFYNKRSVMNSYFIYL